MQPTALESEDGDLVEAARLGRPGPYAELYRRHRERVARAAYLLVGNAHAAQDVSQEAFLIGWRDLQRLREPELFRPWVTGIAMNLCRRRLRATREIPVGTPIGGGGPDAGSVDVKVSVTRAVRSLSLPLREAVVLRFYCGFSEREIGTALGVAAGTVKSRLARARRQLEKGLRSIVEVE